MAHPSFHALGEGTKLPSGYVVRRTLGTDPLGATYLARDSSLERDVLIREYLPAAWCARGPDGDVAPRSDAHGAHFEEGKERFLADARALAEIEHPHMARVLGVVEASGTAFSVMEHVPGRTLAEVVEADGPLPEEAVRALLDELADGLAEAHARDVPHLDIGPDYVVLREGESLAVLTGFGSAASQTRDVGRDLWTAPAPGYAPIEQYSRRGNPGSRADLYALGALGYFALTGETPVDAPERALDDTLPDVRVAAPGPVTAPLARALRAAMAVRAADRPPDVEAWRALLAAERGGGLGWLLLGRNARAARSGAPALRLGRAFSRSRLFYAAGVAVVVAGAIVVVDISRNTALTPEERARAGEALLDLSPDILTSVEAGLAAEGFFDGVPDDSLDADSRAGLGAWQEANALPVTGYLDRAVVTVLAPLGEEALRLAEVARIEAEEAARLAEEEALEEARLRAEEAERLAEQRLAEARRLADAQQLAEVERREAEIRAAELEREAEERRLEAERLAEQERLAEERRLEEERLAAEQRAEEERQAAHERRAEEEREAQLLAEARALAAARQTAQTAQATENLGPVGTLLSFGSALTGSTGRLNWRREVNWVRWTGLRFSGQRVTGIDLASQALGGSIPAMVAQLSGLTYLRLSDNLLTGAIPREIGSLSRLEVLYLENNQLAGPLPADLGRLIALEDLFLQNNRLVGPIPPELGALRNLGRLRLSSNGLTGEIPAELASIRSLEALFLNGNQLTGEIPRVLEQLPNLQRLSLSNNRLSGCIPRGLSRFASTINPQQGGVVLRTCILQ